MFGNLVQPNYDFVNKTPVTLTWRCCFCQELLRGSLHGVEELEHPGAGADRFQKQIEGHLDFCDSARKP